MTKYAIAVVLLLALLLTGGYWFWSATQNRFVVVNESGQPISVLAITVCGETIRFTNIPPGARVSAPFRINGDDHFAVWGRLEDGTEVEEDCGYVTNGMFGERASFIILPDGKMEFKQWR